MELGPDSKANLEGELSIGMSYLQFCHETSLIMLIMLHYDYTVLEKIDIRYINKLYSLLALLTVLVAKVGLKSYCWQVTPHAVVFGVNFKIFLHSYTVDRWPAVNLIQGYGFSFSLIVF